jgi:hypothetical protein
MRQVTLDIPETKESYTDGHATDSDGTNWVRVDLANGIINATEHNLGAMRREYAALAAASVALLERYVDLINCGDCGNWNPETEEVVIAMRQELAKVDRPKR